MDEQRMTGETGDKNAVIDQKLRQFFDGKIVRKDLTKKIKEGANVPVYVLEFLLGQYCSSDDPEVIETGVENVKRILADNYVRPDEAQKILSMLRQRGMHTVIDKITVNLNMKKDTYEAEFSNLGIKNIPISEDYPAKFDRLLCGGIWCIVQLEYEFLEEEKNASPIHIRKLTPIQMPHVDIEELKEGRKNFTEEEWLEIMLRSCGYEPDKLNDRERWLLLARIKIRWKKPITPTGRTRCCCTQTWSAQNVSWRRASFRITRIFAARFYWSNTRRKSRMKPPRISMNCRGNVFWMMCLQTTRKKGWRCGGGFWTSQNRL